jgi:hypothetical protein
VRNGGQEIIHSFVICCCCSLSAAENLYCDFNIYGELRTILRKEANIMVGSTYRAASHRPSSIVHSMLLIVVAQKSKSLSVFPRTNTNT